MRLYDGCALAFSAYAEGVPWWRRGIAPGSSYTAKKENVIVHNEHASRKHPRGSSPPPEGVHAPFGGSQREHRVDQGEDRTVRLFSPFPAIDGRGDDDVHSS